MLHQVAFNNPGNGGKQLRVVGGRHPETWARDAACLRPEADGDHQVVEVGALEKINFTGEIDNELGAASSGEFIVRPVVPTRYLAGIGA